MAVGVQEGLPGAELVARGLDDLAHGRVSAEALLVSRFESRLAAVGARVQAPPLDDAERRLYELLEETRGNGAHSAYNALTRRIVSYLRAAERARSR